MSAISANRCNICKFIYEGLANDCACTNWGAAKPATFSDRKGKILEYKMAVANAVEDHSDALLHAFIGLLVDLEYMTEPDVLKALEKFDESLQAPSSTES